MSRALHSELLLQVPGLAHGFSTRMGGVSPPPFDSLNLAQREDAAENLAENRRRFAAEVELPAPPEAWREAKQVHGVEILNDDTWRPGAGFEPSTEADGLITARPGTVVAVRTADCVPLLMVRLGASGPEAVGAIHCGWRGTVSGIVPRAVRALAGTRPERLRCALGPSISLRAFEVGPEVIERAKESLGGDPPPTHPGPRGRDHLDLPAVVRMHLERAGVNGSSIDDLALCTYSRPEQFFSYRRDGRCGHHLAVIGWRAD